MYTTLILTNTILIFFVILYKLVQCYQYFSKNKKFSIGRKEVTYLKKDRSEIFNSLINDINTVVEWCVQNMYPSESDTLRLLSNWKKIKMYETNFMDHVAYVIDKNKKFFLCVSTPDGEDEDHNTIRFVALHELAHMMSASYGHNKEFNTNFLHLLNVAVKLKVYQPIDYSMSPTRYCGTSITNSPCNSSSCNKLLLGY